MPKIIFIAGEPATGKTTLMREVIKRLGGLPTQVFKYGRVRGHHWEARRLFLFGIYEEGQKFAGTDRLSMSAVADAVPFLSTLAPEDTVLAEGDRLFNRTFLDAAGAFDRALVFLRCSSPLLDARHQDRGDSQSEVWLRGRRTKAERLLLAFPWTEIRSETPEDLQAAAGLVEGLLARPAG